MADVLGMRVDFSDHLTQPIGVVVVVKALDDEDDISYFIGKSDDVTRVEAVGMLTVAADEFRAGLAELRRSDES